MKAYKVNGLSSWARVRRFRNPLKNAVNRRLQVNKMYIVSLTVEIPNSVPDSAFSSVQSTLQSDIFNFLEILITTDWYTLSLDDRRSHIRRFQGQNNISGAYRRDRVSVKEIACELYNYELNQPIDRKFSLEISRTLTALGWNKTGKAEWIAPYGTTKVYYRY